MSSNIAGVQTPSWRRGLSALVGAEFLGAVNDNLFKMVVSLFAIGTLAAGHGGSGYLSLTGLVFVLPYLLFCGYSGYLADVVGKRAVLVAAKAFEFIVVVFTVPALLFGSVPALLVILFMMAAQTVFFSPAKYGILPEMLPSGQLSRANGWLEAGRYSGIILGTAAGGLLLAVCAGQPAYIGFLLVAVAAAGLLLSIHIVPVPRSGARRSFPLNPWRDIGRGIRRALESKALGAPIFGLVFWEFASSLVALDMLLVAKEVMGLPDASVGLLAACGGLGLGAGCFCAGRVSGERVRLALAPIGAAAVACGLGLLACADSLAQAAPALATVAFFGGFLYVPCNAALQQNAARDEKGQLAATNNFLGMAAVCLSSIALYACRDILGIPAQAILLLVGALTLVWLAIALRVFPAFRPRFIVGRGRAADIGSRGESAPAEPAVRVVRFGGSAGVARCLRPAFGAARPAVAVAALLLMLGACATGPGGEAAAPPQRSCTPSEGAAVGAAAGAFGGAAQGVLAGITFPPAMIVTVPVGAAVGTIAGSIERAIRCDNAQRRDRAAAAQQARAPAQPQHVDADLHYRVALANRDRRPDLAARAMCRAAHQRHAAAMFAYAAWHAEGRLGAPDLVQAHVWYARAEAAGQPGAAPARRALERRMSAADLADAQARASVWVPAVCEPEPQAPLRTAKPDRRCWGPALGGRPKWCPD